MANRIGFMANHGEEAPQTSAIPVPAEPAAPRKSLVQVRFPGRGILAYYNDRFDLQPGDRVYVEGTRAGIQGMVESVSYNFKIKVSDYCRVIAKVDTQVRGQLFLSGSHFVSFDPAVLPYEKVLRWFKAPTDGDEGYESSSDGSFFPLDDLSQMGIRDAVGERGQNYYMENRVRYLSLEGTKGRAIVEGTVPYEVEFRFWNGQISELVCDCPCAYRCKHEVATLLQLRELLAWIQERYPDRLGEQPCFTAICKMTLFRFALADRDEGTLTL